jgi:hypothetical protein
MGDCIHGIVAMTMQDWLMTVTNHGLDHVALDIVEPSIRNLHRAWGPPR